MWSILFVVSIAQGVFFLLLLSLSGRYRNTASVLLCFMLILFLITNIDYYLVSSGLFKSFPWFFGMSNGLILLMGPALLLYSRSLLHNYRLRVRDLLHTIPYVVFILLSIPIFLLSFEQKVSFINLFVSGELPLRSIDYAILVLQLIHLAVYLFFVRNLFRDKSETRSLEHEKWIRSLRVLLFGYGVLVLCLVIVAFVTGRFSLFSNYTYSLACSFLLYIVTGFALLNPSTTFEFLRRTRKPLDTVVADGYWERLLELMERDKVFVKPEIKLMEVAKMVGLPSHSLSQLVNERAGKNFSDFVNQYRVEEFKTRVRQPGSDQLTLVGLALEIGFNSKTSFNNTFKKFTGLTPSEYKRTIQGETDGMRSQFGSGS